MQVTAQIPISDLKRLEEELKREMERRVIITMDALCEIGRKCVDIAKSLPQNGSRAQYPAPYEVLPPHQIHYVDWTTNRVS